MLKSLIAGGALAALAITGAWVSTPTASHITLDPNGEPFKSAFNADSGKTRIVMLVAPT